MKNSCITISVLTLLFLGSCMYKNRLIINDKIMERDSELFRIQKSFSLLEHLKPNNFNSEKDIFFKKLNAKEIYNPKFSYSKNIDFSGALLQELEDLKDLPNSYLLSSIFNEKKKELILDLQLLESIGEDLKFSSIAKDIYGLPDKNTYEFAINFLSNVTITKEIENYKYDAEYAANYFRKILKNMNLNEWQVIVTNEISAKANVNSNKHILQINKSTKFSESFLKQLKFHEIMVHIQRSENGKKLPIKLLSLGLAGYISTEEGLAAYNEEINKVLSKKTMKKYCGRVVAVYLSKNLGFYQVFNKLKEYDFTNEEAFTIVYRIKRGLVDTSHANGFPKDYVYLKGYLDIKNYVKNGGDIVDLFNYGKTHISHIKILKQIFD